MWEGLGFACPGAGRGSAGSVFTPKPEPLGGSTGSGSAGAADLNQNLTSNLLCQQSQSQPQTPLLFFFLTEKKMNLIPSYKTAFSTRAAGWLRGGGACDLSFPFHQTQSLLAL